MTRHGPLLLVDFNNAAWRASFALRNAGLTADNGDQTTVLYGLLGEVARYMQQYGTDRVVLCADHPDGPALRKSLYAEYKSRNNDLTDEEKTFRQFVAAGMVTAKTYLRDAGFGGYFQKVGYEADDLIATFDQVFWEDEKVVVSTDKDLYQLIAGNLEVCRPGSKQNRMTLQTFHAEYGISPVQWVEVKAIAGCSTDNVPGMRGVGEATAVKYVLGTLPDSRRHKIEAYRATDQYALARRLVKLPFDQCLVKPARAAVGGHYLTERVWRAVCRRAGIRSLPYPV